jgi:hypothetical protein
MISVGDSTIKEVSGITETEKKAISYFLQGAVYCWCKNKKGEWFAMRDLMGGDNRDWKDTPLEVLYKKHISNGKNTDESFESAGKESGWMLKKVLHADSRNFESKNEDTKNYRWIP